MWAVSHINMKAVRDSFVNEIKVDSIINTSKA